MSRHSKNEGATSQRLPIGRREFLVMASACAVAPSMGAFGQSSSATRTAPLQVLPLSVGFLEQSEDFARLDRTPWSLAGQEADVEMESWESSVREVGAGEGYRVVPASSLLLGDGELSFGSVRVSLHGLFPRFAGDADDGLESVTLLVEYPSPDGTGGRVPFLAWAFDRRPAPRASQSVKFVVPLEASGGLTLSLDVTQRVAVPSRLRLAVRNSDTLRTIASRFEGRFTIDDEAGQPRLRRGVYFLGLQEGSWEAPRVLPSNGGDGLPWRLRSLVFSVEAV